MTRLDPAHNPWMTDPAALAVMRALTANGAGARFVGGAVRNALLGAPVTDVDIATPLTPDVVTKRLTAAGLTAVPTGIEHGTVTAVSSGRPFEVTTLRRDVSTDGRRAVVAFTTDWNEDAQRRDFTMNALYADRDGTIFDPTGGIEDLKAGRVRFIGDATARIREDYLRILRFFRFYAWYGKGALDPDALAAATANKDGLSQLSGERIQKEMLKLLAALDPIPVLREMHDTGILAEILPANPNLSRLLNLIALEGAHDFAHDPVLHLAAMLPSEREAILAVANRWRLSNGDRDRLLASIPTSDTLNAAPQKSIYRYGATTFQDRFLLAWASEGGAPKYAPILTTLRTWTPPTFPITGTDVMSAGIAKGPRVGEILSQLESFWLDHNFNPTREELLKRLKEIAKTQPSP